MDGWMDEWLDGWMAECKNRVAVTVRMIMCHIQHETWIPKGPWQEEFYWHGGHINQQPAELLYSMYKLSVCIHR